MLDISQARRLTTIAKKRIEEQDELEYEVLSEWEQRAIEFMSDPYLHDILMEFIDTMIAYSANQGASSCLIACKQRAGGHIIVGVRCEELLYYSNTSFGEPNHWMIEINTLIDTYDFMSTSDTETILQILWATLSEIVIPVYEESYAIERRDYSSTEHEVCLNW